MTNGNNTALRILQACDKSSVNILPMQRRQFVYAVSIHENNSRSDSKYANCMKMIPFNISILFFMSNPSKSRFIIMTLFVNAIN
jgi:hypothetical protein